MDTFRNMNNFLYDVFFGPYDEVTIFRPTEKSQLVEALWNYNHYKERAIDIYGYINTWDVTAITDMSNIFENLKDINENINDWDTSNVVNMSCMFKGCHYFNNGGEALKIKTDKVEDMSCMFEECLRLDVEICFETKNVKYMEYMFSECIRFDNGDKELKFDTHNVVNMSCMFKECINFTNNNKDLNFDTSKVENISGILRDCKSFRSNCYWDLDNVKIPKLKKIGNPEYFSYNQSKLRENNFLILRDPMEKFSKKSNNYL